MYFRGLGSVSRLRIVELLRREDELPVGELAARLGLTQPNASSHLACLRWCGFVQTRREHRVVYNRVADDRVVRIISLALELLERSPEHAAMSCAPREPDPGEQAGSTAERG